MAQNVTTAFVTLFESEVKQAYQAEFGSSWNDADSHKRTGQHG